MKLAVNKMIGASSRWIVFLLIFIFILLPFIWMLITSIKTRPEVMTIPIIYFPKRMTITTFLYFINQGALKFLRNSLIITICTVLLTLSLAIPAAYASSRFTFRGKKAFLVMLVATQMFPGVLLIVPLYKIMFTFHLLDSYFALIFANVVSVLPFSIIILFTFLHAIPRTLDEAGLVDGCSSWSVLWKIIFPVSLPGIISVAVYNFIFSWNEYMFALTFISHDELKTLQVGLAGMKSQYLNTWADIMAGSVIAVLPVLILFFIFQRFLMKGLTAGAIKG